MMAETIMDPDEIWVGVAGRRPATTWLLIAAMCALIPRPPSRSCSRSANGCGKR